MQQLAMRVECRACSKQPCERAQAMTMERGDEVCPGLPKAVDGGALMVALRAGDVRSGLSGIGIEATKAGVGVGLRFLGGGECRRTLGDGRRSMALSENGNDRKQREGG